MGIIPETIRILSADDHPILREGVAALIDESKEHAFGRGSFRRTRGR